MLLRCISFDSYIKPQPIELYAAMRKRCISFDSYIKPQRTPGIKRDERVVYLLTPTSNHNTCNFMSANCTLYIF